MPAGRNKCHASKTDANVKEMKEEMMAKLEDEIRTDQERMEAKIEANNEKSGVFLGPLVSRMDMHQARTKANQRETTAKMHTLIERTEACVGKLEANPEIRTP
jgi:adenine-specific DNA methylase